MCLVIFVNQERFTREGARVEAKYRRRFPRLMTWLFGPQAPPPHYDERIPTQQSQIKPVTIRPDSLTLPKYGGLRKHVGDQISKEKDDLQEVIQDK